jgi:EmrB/QacA subfamily drug resistance transporter
MPGSGSSNSSARGAAGTAGTAKATGPDPVGDDHGHARRVLLLASLGSFVVALDTTIVNIAFPTISRSFQASTEQLAWVLNAYSLVFAAMLIPAGWVADRYGRKRVFIGGLIGFAAMSAMCGLAPDAGVLIAGRALQAAFAALVVPTSLALILPEFPPNKRPMAIGTWGSMGAVAAAVAPTVGAMLTEYASWRWIFLINVPIVLIMLVFGSRVLRESPVAATSRIPDPAGAVLVAAIPALLSLALLEGSNWGWSNPRVIGGFVVAFVLLPLFLWRCATSKNPIMDLTLFRVRQFRLVNAGTLLFSTAFFGLLLSGVVFLQTVWHYSVLDAALATAPGPLVVIALARPSGRLAGRIGHRRVLLAGAVFWALGSVAYAMQTSSAPNWAGHWLPGTILIGIGSALTLPIQPAAASQSLPPQRFAVGSAINASFRQLGAVLGVSIFVAFQGSAPRTSLVVAFQYTWLVFAALGLAAGLVVWIPKLIGQGRTPSFGAEV